MTQISRRAIYSRLGAVMACTVVMRHSAMPKLLGEWGKESSSAETALFLCLHLLKLVVLGCHFLLGDYMDHEVYHSIAVAKIFVIPEPELDKVMIIGDANTSIKSGGVSATVKVSKD